MCGEVIKSRKRTDDRADHLEPPLLTAIGEQQLLSTTTARDQPDRKSRDELTEERLNTV